MVDRRALPEAHELALLVRPARLVDKEHHRAQASLLFIGVYQRDDRRDDVASADRGEIAVALSAVEAAAVPAPEPLPPPPPIDDVVVRVRDGIRRLDRVRRLTDALDALGDALAS